MRDAGRPEELPVEQATRTAERFFPPTPTPSPAPPLPPTVETVVITLGVGPDNAPSGSYATVPADAGTAFASALLHDVHPGQAIAAEWTDANGTVVGTSKADVTADADQQWFAFPLQLNGSLAPGDYAVYVFSGERTIASLAFTLTGPGTGPQLLPDLPTNPQVEPTAGPAPTTAPGGGNNGRINGGDVGGNGWNGQNGQNGQNDKEQWNNGQQT